MAKILLEYPDEMQAEVDRVRGLVPRNAWIRETIEHRLRDARMVHVPEPTPSREPGATRPSKPVPTDDDAPHDPATCLHPKNRQRLLNGGAVVCDLCHGRVR